MPTYGYKCPEGHSYSEVRPMTADQIVKDCPQCGAELSRVFDSNLVVFKGRGFYKTGG